MFSLAPSYQRNDFQAVIFAQLVSGMLSAGHQLQVDLDRHVALGHLQFGQKLSDGRLASDVALDAVDKDFHVG